MRKQRLLPMQQFFHARPFLGFFKTGGTIFGNQVWLQRRLLGKLRRIAFATKNEGSNDRKILIFVNHIIGLHGPQHAIVQQSHKEGFGRIVQVLGQDQFVAPVFACRGVEYATFHAGTIRTQGRGILGRGAGQNVTGNVMIRDLGKGGLHVVLEGGGIVGIFHLGVNGTHVEIKIYG